jgi:hypothetical protein
MPYNNTIYIYHNDSDVNRNQEPDSGADGHKDDALDSLIKRFGKEIVLKWCLSKTLTLIIVYNEEDFDDDDNTAYGIDLYHVINDCYDDVEQLPENKAILNRLYDRFYQAYAPKYKKKFEGIDLEIDPITCDTMINPAYILTDWNNNCKIVYSLDTILKFYANEMRYTSFDVDADGNDIYYEKQIRLDYFISPYTQSKFYTSDIICLKQDLLNN